MRNIRKTALIAGFALALFGGGPTARAQQAMIDEIVRKSEAREPESGFCARTGWPNGDNWEGFKAFLTTAEVGTWKINTFANGACELNRVTEVHNEAGAKCVSYSIWVCGKDRNCGTGKVVDCLDRNGKLNRKEN